VGNPDTSTIYIIDFDLCKKYRSTRTGKHIIFSKTKKFIGTLEFCSINSMKGVEMTRRDDMESIGYMLIFLITGTLPWFGIEGSCSERYEKVYKIKANISNEDLCKGLPIEMCKYMKYVKSLKYEEDPDYDYLRRLFFTILFKMKERFDLNFSWTQQIKPRKTSLRNFRQSTISKLFGGHSMFNQKIKIHESPSEIQNNIISLSNFTLNSFKRKIFNMNIKNLDIKIKEENESVNKDDN
jgi:hypothetical protein